MSLDTLTNPGGGYRTAPTVSFTGGGGAGAAATVRLAATGNSASGNLFWARRTLAGKQLLAQIVDEE